MSDHLAGRLNALADTDARSTLTRCCGARRWVDRVLHGRPYANDAALFAAAEREWWALEPGDWLEAFAAHPRIGGRTSDAWSRAEQSEVEGAAAATRGAFARGNEEYEARFGYVFLICATGQSAEEMLAQLRQRLGNDPAAELRVAAAEQAKITRLRLERLGSP